MPVHIYGQPYEINEIKKFAKKIKIVDDCAEAVGAKYKNIVGLENDCSCFVLLTKQSQLGKVE